MTRTANRAPSPGAYETIAVLGGGAWGSALALTAARAGGKTILWARDQQTVDAINAQKANPAYLPEVTFDAPITATNRLEDAVTRADMVLMVTPAQTTRDMARTIRPLLRADTPVILCAKGIERGTGKLLSTILEENLPEAIPAVLSGPSFAADVARGLPTAVTIAAENGAAADKISQTLALPSFRPYSSTDIVGAQIGGALKNVLAIACGAVYGKGWGASAQAALTARGFAELSRLGEALGARRETLTGLSGLGDLVLTCASEQSRNFAFGAALGRGAAVRELLGSNESAPQKLAEGVYSAQIAVDLGRRHQIELPIASAVAAVLNEQLDLEEALLSLMTRPLKREAPIPT